MTETVSVSISGIAFSFISYENVKCGSNQEGFVLGDFVSKETNHVTDAEHQVINKENIIKVKSIIPCPHQFYFYNSSGKLDLTKLNSLLGNQKEKVVGWYLFKHKNILPKLTLREKIVHKQIAELFNLPLSVFTTCLLTLKNSNNNATYSFNQTFLRYHLSKFESLPLRITNLTVPNYLFKLPEPMPNVLKKIVENVRLKNSDIDGHMFIQKIQEGLQCHMTNLIEESIEKEEKLFKLEEEVKQLKQSLTLGHTYGNKLNNFSENGVLEGNTSSLENMQSSDDISESNVKKRPKQRKNVSPSQNKYNTRSGGNACDGKVESIIENVSYSSIAKRKNVDKK